MQTRTHRFDAVAVIAMGAFIIGLGLFALWKKGDPISNAIETIVAIVLFILIIIRMIVPEKDIDPFTGGPH